jgi:hypothetical protein
VTRRHCSWRSARRPVVLLTGITTVGRNNGTAGTRKSFEFYWSNRKESVMRISRRRTFLMFLNQPLRKRNPIGTEVANQLAHVESELCWCDPIVETDEYGQKVVMHKDVTWH